MTTAVKQTANQIREQLHGQLRERFGADDVHVWVEDFDPDDGWVAFEISPDDGAPTTWRLGYSSDGESVTIDGGDPTEVIRTVDYAPKSAPLSGPIVRKDAAKRIAYGAVLVPGEPDSDGEVLTAEKVEEAAHTWLAEFRALDRQHSVKQIDAAPVESYVEPDDRVVEVDGEELVLPAGTWIMAAKVNDDETWGEIEDGTRTGFSIMGVPRAELAAALSAVKSGDTAALKRVTLADVGGGDPNGDWVAPFVSIVAEPAVPKAKFFAVKAARDERGLFRRFSEWLAGEEGGAPAAKAGRKFSDQTFRRLKAASEAVTALVAEAEAERNTDNDGAAKALDQEDEVDRDEVQTIVSESVPEAVKAALADDETISTIASAVKAAIDDTNDGGATGGDEDLEAFKTKVLEKLDALDQRTAPKSRQLNDDGDEPTGPATKSRDLFGRTVKA